MEVAEWIAAAVEAGPVQGSQLAQDLRRRFPDWVPQQEGARNLRDFVERLVDGVSVVGMSGMDVVYGATEMRPESGIAMPIPAASSSSAVNLWRTWVSPGGPYSLSVDPVEGDVTQTLRSELPASGRVRVDPAPHGFHQQVARDFAASRPENEGELLPAIGTSEGWWRSWLQILKSLGLENVWHEHRTAALEARLIESLEEAGLSGEGLQRAVARVVADRSARRQASPTGRDRSPGDERAALLHVLEAAIRKMDLSDLRELKIPIGVLLDVVAQRPLP